jgi:parallel beta-helix repeat protein
MRQTAVATLTLISIITLGVVCVQPIKAEYQGNITINADGNINPSTAPIQQTGNTYTLTSDVDGNIAVKASNVVLDGKGFTVFGGDSLARGVSLADVSNVTVKGFLITNFNYGSQAPMVGIELTNVTHTVVTNNTIIGMNSIFGIYSSPFTGIIVKGGNSNTITGNNLKNNLHGLDFLNTSNNRIIGNNIEGQPITGVFTTGISFINSKNNKIYHNNFVNNTHQVKVSDSVNAWDDGYLGNYWSNYKTKHPNAIQIDDSGTYNIPYAIDTQNIDTHPLTQPYSNAFYAPKIPLKISVLSPENQTFNESSVSLSFAVNKQTVWMGYSLDGQDNVTVTGNATLSGLSSGLHNITVYARDEFNNVGASETINFNVEVPKPFPAAPVTAVSVAIVILVIAGLVVYFKKRALRVQREKTD